MNSLRDGSGLASESQLWESRLKYACDARSTHTRMESGDEMNRSQPDQGKHYKEGQEVPELH